MLMTVGCVQEQPKNTNLTILIHSDWINPDNKTQPDMLTEIEHSGYLYGITVSFDGKDITGVHYNKSSGKSAGGYSPVVCMDGIGSANTQGHATYAGFPCSLISNPLSSLSEPARIGQHAVKVCYRLPDDAFAAEKCQEQIINYNP